MHAPAALANIVLTGTRIVFPEERREVSVPMRNVGEHSLLVEAWIDQGDAHARPDTIETPFILSPPLFRLEPHRAQTLRLIYDGDPLPRERESLFWLNVLEIPPKPKPGEAGRGEGVNYLQLAIRTRIKLFFRPKGLTGSLEQAARALRWSVARASGKGGFVLVATNRSQYYITFSKIMVQEGAVSEPAGPGMVAPFATLALPLHGWKAGVDLAEAGIDYVVIDDLGAAVPLSGVVSP